MKPTYYYHTEPSHSTRIKVCAKTIIWERNTIVNLDAVIDHTEEPVREWKFYLRKSLPLTAENSGHLKTLYNLPDEVVAQLERLKA